MGIGSFTETFFVGEDIYVPHFGDLVTEQRGERFDFGFPDAFSAQISSDREGPNVDIDFIVGVDKKTAFGKFEIEDRETSGMNSVATLTIFKAPSRICQIDYFLSGTTIGPKDLVHHLNGRQNYRKIGLANRQETCLLYYHTSEGKLFVFNPHQTGSHNTNYIKSPLNPSETLSDHSRRRQLMNFLLRQQTFTLERGYQTPVAIVNRAHEDVFLSMVEESGTTHT